MRFIPRNSSVLDEGQWRRLEEALGARLSKEGVLSIRSDRYRTQLRNRKDCLEKFAALLASLLGPPPPRRRPYPTDPGSRGAAAAGQGTPW